MFGFINVKAAEQLEQSGDCHSNHHCVRIANVSNVSVPTCVAQTLDMGAIFPNEEALLHLASALLVAIDEEWQIGKIYLT